MLDKKGLHLRAALFRNIRKFFYNQGFLEVDTPIRQPVLIPESNILPLKSGQQYLQASPELCMKRLLAAGCEKIFQICHCFRSEECGRYHLEEFQMLEWYRQDADYNSLMDDCEVLLKFLFDEFKSHRDVADSKTTFFPDLDLSASWQRLTVHDAFSRYSPMSLEEALEKNLFDEILVESIEPQLGFDTPLFLYDYPLVLGSLARAKPENNQLAERFELYIKGVELANGFTELTDELEQRQRFQAELETIALNRQEQQQMPELFLQDLENLHSAAGIALGIDRLFMLALGGDNINDVIPFSPFDLF